MSHLQYTKRDTFIYFDNNIYHSDHNINSIENDVIGMKDLNSPPKYINEEKCLECGICYLICPQTHILDDDLNKTYNFTNFSSMPFGFIDNIYSCQATDKDFLNL